MSEERELTLGFSPCPNDTYIFYALLHGKVRLPGFRFSPIIEDVEELNRLAMAAMPDITKVSCHVLGHILDGYCLLSTGGALGRGCGPLLVAREPLSPERLRGRKVAVPGRFTTAFLLLSLYDGGVVENAVPMPFNQIMEEISKGGVDAGLIIHEGRFTYRGYGLHQIVDLGKWWEEETGLPIPLGGIVTKRSLGEETISGVEKVIRESLLYARTFPDEPAEFIAGLAQEISKEVQKRHIELYVNDFSIDMGKEGREAVKHLLERGYRNGILPRINFDIFCS